MFDNLILGAQVALHWNNLLYAFAGVFIGNLIGVLPGIGAMAAISMLLPMTYGIPPVAALMMLAGIYYGTSFGGATTSILLNLPGTATHAVVCLDGNPMAKQGRGGQAIFMAMFASFVGVTVGIIIMAAASIPITELAFKFGPQEYFSLMVLALIAASVIGSGETLKGIASVILGLLIGVVGLDITTGTPRFDFGLISLQEGVSLVALAMGLFGISDVFTSAGNIGEGSADAGGKKITAKSVRPSGDDFRRSTLPIARGFGIGAFLGALPGTGGTLASFMSYSLEKKLSKHPEKFGTGEIEGVAGPESANSSASITAFIPTLTLGVPGDAVMALMLGALVIHDIIPGPNILANQPELFWGLIASFWIGNVLLMILNIPFISLWVRLLSVPYRLIFPVVLCLICLGVYSEKYSLFDVAVVGIIGGAGVLFAKIGMQPGPILLGFVLGPMLEENFRRSLVIARGSLMSFIERPISGVCLGICALILLWMGRDAIKRRRRPRPT
ncbi:tripartite tricarboxylate transporter permease [Melaminivora sp.]|uniref:tripartite tricarboxylate transporter permease n=1 Tax=Melaminivora sp. TaxID=1933032 RepID=UPI0028A8DC93|nr:tripartite tricarboxylate transporter permease [Melaminivora sp.]